ncbi:glycerophosphodiester phosphodiesterase [Aeromicrobium terrae]|uniref:glycerophosphodiester phosphodiesterase n=1 Tax=Aeromicrobium terrae TaxID=2498846 RepID=UPI00164EFA62|nr:glycerophosphodiester phosphodiesterase [Aeromicrobium terrae]
MTVLVSAHRGGAGDDGVQNSLEAVEAAIDLGCDFVEVDLRRDRHGRLVVSHDAPGDDSAPFDAVLDLVAGRAGLHLDLKITEGALEVVDDVVDRIGTGHLVVTSADDGLVRALRTRAEERGSGLLVGLSTSRRSARGRIDRWWTHVVSWFPRTRMRLSHANVVASHHVLARHWLRSWARHRQLPLLVWTVDDPVALDFWMNDPDTWVVTTNHPARALAARRS